MNEATRLSFLAEGGLTGELIRSTDWSQTAVGPVAGWSTSLLATVGMILHSRHPMFLWWGSELVQFYNDAYLPSFGRGKHPGAMGQRGRECWAEIWPVIGPQIEAVMTSKRASWNEDALVPIHRNDRLEEVYWTYGYSPVFDDDGSVGGTLVVCTETTSRVIDARRAGFLRLLNEKLATREDLDGVMELVRQLSAGAGSDLPFVITCRLGSEGWQRTGSTNLLPVDLAAIDGAIRRELGTRILDAGIVQVPSPIAIQPQHATWPEPVTELAICTPAKFGLEAVVVGLSPRLSFSPPYVEFLEQLVGQIELAANRLEAAQARLSAESERRNLLLQAPVATALLTGPLHVFELANPLYKKMVGREVVGKAYLEAFPEIVGTPLAAILDRVYTAGEPFVAHAYLVPLDRTGSGVLEDCYFQFNLEPIRDAQGKVYGMMAVAVDVTEQVQARQVLEKAGLEQERLLAQLSAVNQAKDEFLATVSHELRTPLTSILAWSRILGEKRDPERLEKGLAVIERNAKAQAQLIEDILDVSRMISGKVQLNPRPFDLDLMMTAVLDEIRPLATAKQLRLLTAIDAGLGVVVADEERLHQIVWNLLSNAVKFTPDGGDIELRASLQDGRLRLSVRDTGKGISAAFLPHVFDRFRQGDTSTTRQQTGLGLGLAIVRHLVELYGGEITARSPGEGLGATFELSLPVDSGLPAAAVGPAAGRSAAT